MPYKHGWSRRVWPPQPVLGVARLNFCPNLAMAWPCGPWVGSHCPRLLSYTAVTCLHQACFGHSDPMGYNICHHLEGLDTNYYWLGKKKLLLVSDASHWYWGKFRIIFVVYTRLCSCLIYYSYKMYSKLLRKTTRKTLVKVFILSGKQERRQETEQMKRGKGKEEFVWSQRNRFEVYRKL